VANVNFLLSEITDLRSQLAKAQKEIERLKEQLRLTNIDWQTEAAENAALRTELAEKEKEIERLRKRSVCVYCGKITEHEGDKLAEIIEHMAVCEKHPIHRAIKAESELAELRERLKLVEEVWVSWGYLDDYITKNVLTTKFAKEMWQAIKAACEEK